MRFEQLMIVWSDDPEYFVPLGQGDGKRRVQASSLMLWDCTALTPTTPLRCSCIFIRQGELGDAAARRLMEVDFSVEVKQAPRFEIRVFLVLDRLLTRLTSSVYPGQPVRAPVVRFCSFSD